MAEWVIKDRGDGGFDLFEDGFFWGCFRSYEWAKQYGDGLFACHKLVGLTMAEQKKEKIRWQKEGPPKLEWKDPLNG